MIGHRTNIDWLVVGALFMPLQNVSCFLHPNVMTLCYDKSSYMLKCLMKWFMHFCIQNNWNRYPFLHEKSQVLSFCSSSPKNINDVQVFYLMRPYLQEVAFYVIFTIILTCKMALPYIWRVSTSLNFTNVFWSQWKSYNNQILLLISNTLMYVYCSYK